ncbi:hypothetical protein K491DRAFT_606568 [Lophiostoma macrostomum CBS 122681]|uniref:Ent-kaurene synthase n=1 Tax=Lophiostoma macrostomum CBS 122681 TaxID=1314788 RepID=A0A6A6SYB8_9PLEO|nr:hypothetical protein K491DRAFT_606568 [Lophiostoma macrostomum CBS 122681]
MNSSTWDLEAEAYLRSVCEVQSANGHIGGFPSAFPSTIFEISWVLDTLFEAGFDKEDFLLADMRKLTVFLESNLKAQKGIVGFPLPDADDTAKTISTLRLLGWDKDVAPMLKAFEAEKSFITYRGERNASSSANCNILLCLLRVPEPAKYTMQIVKAVAFLSRFWMDNNGPDKWHTSVHYPMMLIAQAFMLFLKRWGKKELDNDQIPKSLISQDVPRTLLEILARTMALQQADGSWESKREVTAYAILTLAPLLSLPWVDFLKPEGIACMYRGKAYLEDNRNHWRDAERLWIEKTVYSSSNLCQAYCLAASKVVVPTAFMPQQVVDLFPAQLSKKVAKMSGFFSRVEPFSKAPQWKMQLSLLQCAPYATALKDARYMVIPPVENASDEKYQEYIPFTWIGCRDFLSTAIPGETLWQMMIVSMLGFQVDAYMETVVWEQYRDRLPDLKAFIRRLCTGSGTTGPRKRKNNGEIGGTPKKLLGSNGVPNGVLNGTTNGSTTHADGLEPDTLAEAEPDQPSIHTNGISAEEMLTRTVNFVLEHPKVLRSPHTLQAWLAHELQAYLLAHITHLEDVAELARSSENSKGPFTWDNPRTTFFDWVRTTSAEHTSCTYAFVFFLCLISDNGADIAGNVHQRYALEDACSHLATMCRQYNDFGSMARDQDERNLNSVNFPEFNLGMPTSNIVDEAGYEQKKKDLLTVAQYERRCLNRVVGELEDLLDTQTMERLRLFIQVTDFYGHIYVARDIGVRVGA